MFILCCGVSKFNLFSMVTYDFFFSFLFFLVQYALFLYRYLKEWRKNPYWSFSCCLALLLPLNDLQGELRGMIETDVLKRQLQTGHLERPTILSALKDSGAIDVTLEDGKHDDDYTAAVHDDDCEDAENKNGKCHQWTQTEPITLSLANIVVHEEVGELQQESMSILKTMRII